MERIKLAYTPCCYQIEESTVGTRILDPQSFLSTLEEQFAHHVASGCFERCGGVEGSHVLSLSESALSHVSAERAPRSSDLADYVVRNVGTPEAIVPRLLMKRSSLLRARSGFAIVMTRECYERCLEVDDPERAALLAKLSRLEATFFVVRVCGFHIDVEFTSFNVELHQIGPRTLINCVARFLEDENLRRDAAAINGVAFELRAWVELDDTSLLVAD